MTDGDNIRELLATLDAGLLAAALTLMTIYPAIAGLVSSQIRSADASVIVAYGKERRIILRSLGASIAASWLALMAIIISIADEDLVKYDNMFVLVCTAVGLGALGYSGWGIFRNAADAS